MTVLKNQKICIKLYILNLYVWNIIPVMEDKGYAKMIMVVIQPSLGDNSRQKWFGSKKLDINV